MLRQLNELKGFTIHATDGNIGTAHDFYFDDEHWTVRYLVADTGGWMRGRLVLISPMSLGNVDWAMRAVNVQLTRRQVEDSPGIATDEPVSHQFETSYYDYYRMPYYWAGPYTWGMWPYPYGYRTAPIPQADLDRMAERHHWDRHLRSASEVKGYHIQARDETFGNVEDFIVEDESWELRYLLVDTVDWWFGKHVIVSPKWIGDIRWSDRKVYLDLSGEDIKSSPEFDASQPMDVQYEERLLGHYAGRTRNRS